MKATSPAPSRVTLETDLSILEDNFRKIREGVAPLGVIAVLKADAYGLGMPEIARRLGRAGAAGIATAELSEALAAQAGASPSASSDRSCRTRSRPPSAPGSASRSRTGRRRRPSRARRCGRGARRAATWRSTPGCRASASGSTRRRR